MRLARSIFTLVVLLLSKPATAEPVVAEALPTEPAGRFDLSLVETVKEYQSHEKLREECRVGFRVRGCTDFPKEELNCHCDFRQGRWLLDAEAHIDAVIKLSIGEPINTVLQHERVHIKDLENGLRAHFNSIMSIRFGSRSACERYAKVLNESPHLRVVMNDLRVASNTKYGCDRKLGIAKRAPKESIVPALEPIVPVVEPTELSARLPTPESIDEVSEEESRQRAMSY